MFNVVIMPASPALAMELAPGDDASRALLAAARALVADFAATRPAEAVRVDIVGSRAPRWHTALTGSLRAWGAPSVNVGGGNYLPELMARYVLGGGTAAEGSDEGTGGGVAKRCVVEETRAHLGAVRQGVLTIVCVDGSAGLTARAPLAAVEGAQDAHLWCETLLSGTPQACDEAALRRAGVLETGLWAELAALTPTRAELRAADSTLGVGRYVAGWEV